MRFPAYLAVTLFSGTAASQQSVLPTAVRPMWSVQGNQGDAQFGQSVAPAGDGAPRSPG